MEWKPIIKQEIVTLVLEWSLLGEDSFYLKTIQANLLMLPGKIGFYEQKYTVLAS